MTFGPRVSPDEISASKPGRLITLLLIAAVISGDRLNAGIVIVIVLGSIGLDFCQTRRAQVAAEGPRAQVAPTGLVQWDSTWDELPRGEPLPGDLIRLSAGMLVLADARLLTASDPHVQALRPGLPGDRGGATPR